MENWKKLPGEKPEEFKDIVFQDANGIQYVGIMDRLGRFITHNAEHIEDVVAWTDAPDPFEGE